MPWPRGLREAGLALGVAASVILPLSIFDVGQLRILETESLDLRFRLRGMRPSGEEIAIVLADDRTLATFGRWPLSRHLFAQAVRALDQAGARLIVFDLLFPEKEEVYSGDLRDAARAAASRLPDSRDEKLRETLQGVANDDADADFVAAVRESGRVLLPFAFAFNGDPDAQSPDFLSDQAYQHLDQSPVEPVFPLQPRSVVTAFAALSRAAAGLGHINISFDRDGAPRYDYLALPFNGDFLPSLPVRAAAAYLGVPWDQVGLALGAGVRLGRIHVPTDQAMRLLVNYRGPRGTIPTYSFVDLAKGLIPREKLAGRIVLIGASFIGSADANPAPFNNTPLPGGERMATLIDSLIAGDFIGENPPPWPLLTIAVVVLLAGMSGVAIGRGRLWVAVLAGLIPLVAWAGGAQLAFNRGLWLPLIGPLVALAAASLSVLTYRYGFVDLQRRRVQAAFRHYLSPALVSQLAANPGRLRLGGETRTISVMFSDIRGFTSISESFKVNPEGLSRLINRGFLTPMTKLIMERSGTIDKYMGDCIMAFWNAPLDDAAHADHACASALAMHRALTRINANLERDARREGRTFHRLQIGVGINTGECVVGNMGSDERFAYTALGDAVNLASRLEGQTKVYRVGVIVGEATRAAAPSWATLELDLVAVKGKQEAARIYALVGDADLAGSPDFTAHQACHQQMLERYRAQDWAGTRAAIDRCRVYDPGLSELYDLYAQRVARFEADPPGADWGGVFVPDTK